MSEYMLMENVTDEELNRLQGKMYDPDHDVKRKKAGSPEDESTANIIELYASLIKEVEGFRQQLKEEIAEVRQLNAELRQTIAAIRGKGITYQVPDDAPRMAAEEIEK